jgi:hypothetical protein
MAHTTASSLLPAPAFLAELATANRILFQQHVVDGFGHVSMRHPERPDHFLLAYTGRSGGIHCNPQRPA